MIDLGHSVDLRHSVMDLRHSVMDLRHSVMDLRHSVIDFRAPFTLGVLIRFQSALGQIALSVNAHQSGSIRIDSIHIHMVDWNGFTKLIRLQV